MSTFFTLTKRNTKLFFKDKGMLFTSLITPIILLILYATFLAKVFKDSFASNIPEGFAVDSKLIDGMVGGQLISSLLAVSCVTVAFCSNLIMVQDKINGSRKDFSVTPVKKSTLALSYYTSTLLTTLIINYVATAVCLGYVAIVGWYMSFTDVLFLILDVFLLTMFGTAISSVINIFLSTNGQASAVGTVVSAGYGFICGAYMPISQFGTGLQNVLSFLPGTYGTSLLRNHALAGVYRKMENTGFPNEVVEGIRESVDCKILFFGNNVSIGAMYGVLIGAIVLLIAVYIVINIIKAKKR